jgi:hypothetical protein
MIWPSFAYPKVNTHHFSSMPFNAKSQSHPRGEEQARLDLSPPRGERRVLLYMKNGEVVQGAASLLIR